MARRSIGYWYWIPRYNRNAIIAQVAIVIDLPTSRRRLLLFAIIIANVSFLFIFLNIGPVVNVEVIFIEMVADVLEAHVPGALLDAVFLLDELVAEAAPEVVVAFATQVHALAGVITFWRVSRKLVFAGKMVGKGFYVIGKLATLRDVCVVVLATPHLLEEVLRVLMALPVVAAPEALIAGWEGAAVRSSVPLHVLTTS